MKPDTTWITNIEICNKLKDFFINPENENVHFFEGLQKMGLQTLTNIGGRYRTNPAASVIVDNSNEDSLTTYKKLRK